VFANAHPYIRLRAENTTSQVEGMIRRTQSDLNAGIHKVFDNKSSI
jgi:hypothetical protein